MATLSALRQVAANSAFLIAPDAQRPAISFSPMALAVFIHLRQVAGLYRFLARGLENAQDFRSGRTACAHFTEFRDFGFGHRWSALLLAASLRMLGWRERK
jgi:hypothetical protein